MISAVHILITGLVQGVGFRPFLYRLARKHEIAGWVSNTNEGVRVLAQGDRNRLDAFLKGIPAEAPAASDIWEIAVTEVPEEPVSGFEIRKSTDHSDAVTEISPDIAVCGECLDDMKRQQNRVDYAFINCTHCGPRFSLVREMPYDRPATSMFPFRMCSSCRREYEDPGDRRFHAQPVACRECGPQYTYREGEVTLSGDAREIARRVSRLLQQGKILAVKGIGGFHLACDARNSLAVAEMRSRKRRERKPFAVMFRSLETLKEYAGVSALEEEALLSWRRPIVILEGGARPGSELPREVSSDLGTVGAFLPYMPFHYLLFEEFPGDAIILTSGNLSSQPIIKDNDQALEEFQGIADAFLLYDREIVNRSDDSIVRVIGDTPRILRRSRGYVPAPVRLRAEAEGILALGAELSAAFCLGKGRQAILSQYLGDLKSYSNYAFYRNTLEDFQRLFRFQPIEAACDLHPDYFTTGIATSLMIPVTRVQHHHAHIASVLAEHGLEEPVIGVALDGTGYGDDGKTWGAEFLVCSLEQYQRKMHLEYIPLPGADKAVEEPWRTAVSWLYRAFGRDMLTLALPFLRECRQEQVFQVTEMIDHKVNCPEASSAGRLFDAVSSILGLCRKETFSSEAPMRLESIAARGVTETYPYEAGGVIGFSGTLRAVAEDVIRGVDAGCISAKFHNTVISVIFDSVKRLREETDLQVVALSGGVFQNRYLLEGTLRVLKEAGFRVYSNERVPANDGGIALGQLAIAARRRNGQ